MHRLNSTACIRNLHYILGPMMMLLFWPMDSLAQVQQFRLSASELGVASSALLSQDRLEVTDAEGKINIYDRDTGFDPEDGLWMSFRNRQSGKILLWPTNNSGHLQIGIFERGVLQFKPSRMRIQPLDNPGRLPMPERSSNGPSSSLSDAGQSGWSGLARNDLFSRIHTEPVSRLPEPQPVHLVSYDVDGMGWAFAQRGAQLGCVNQYNPQAVWWAAPAGPGLVRLQLISDGMVMAVSAVDRQQLRLSLVANDPRQFWRVCPGFHHSSFFLLENSFFGGYYMTHMGFGNIGMQPMVGLPTQLWAILSPPVTEVALLKPFWRSVSREILPNPPLPPAEVELFNSHSSAVVTLIGDQRQNQGIQHLRIEANSSGSITVERDAGATLIESVEVLSPLGDWSRQEFVTQIPPSRFIDLSVYEEFLQSIAIDRTGKSPNRVEDINYAPRSVGMFYLPAGSDLPENTRIDVFARATAAGNPGAVRRLNPDSLEKERPDPIQSILERELDRENKQPVVPSDGRRSF